MADEVDGTRATSVGSEPAPGPTTNEASAAYQPKGSVCKAVRNCTMDPQHLRKVISQYFGRNKRETRAIPEEFWDKWCRKHYQRLRYRREVWVRQQIALINDMIDRLEEHGKVRGWTVTIRKTEEMKLRDPKFAGKRLREEFLIKWMGKGKSFDYVRRFVNEVVANECAEGGEAELPHFQLLPDMDTYPVRIINEAASEPENRIKDDGQQQQRRRQSMIILLRAPIKRNAATNKSSADVFISDADNSPPAPSLPPARTTSSLCKTHTTRSHNTERQIMTRQRAFRNMIQKSSRNEDDPYRRSYTTAAPAADSNDTGFTAVNGKQYKPTPVTATPTANHPRHPRHHHQTRRLQSAAARRQKKVAARKLRRGTSV